MSDRHLELGVFAPTIGCAPSFGKNAFALVSSAEQRTEPTYDYNLRIAQLLDRSGLEIFFMAQRGGAGFGPARFWSYSLDSFTTAAGLAMATRNLQLISTVHTAFYHPGMVARMGATLDQISQGRWALNLVSGWAEQDFRMLDIPLLEHDKRYAQSTEFVEVLKKFWTEDWFDYAGEFFSISQGTCYPKPARPPRLYNAGSSPVGRDFAARHCDWYFAGAQAPELLAEEVADVRARAAKQGRTVKVIIYLFVLCRDTEAAAHAEVEEIFEHAEFDSAREWLETLTGQTVGTVASTLGQGVSVEDMLRSVVLGVGSGKLIGTPEQVAHALTQFHAAGADAVGLTFRHVEEELRDFTTTVVPLLEREAVRRPQTPEPALAVDTLSEHPTERSVRPGLK